MTDYRGVNGTKLNSKNTDGLPFGIVGGYLACFMKDYLSVPGALGDGDRIPLGKVRSDAYLDGDLSKITFDDMGTSVTIDIIADSTVPEIADALNGNSISKLATAIDVATAAGSASLLAGVPTTGKHLPLWQQLNMAWDPGCEIELFAKFSGNPGTGNIGWKLIGS
jgi:hypothetical protein